MKDALQLKFSEGAPSHPGKWDGLCLENGNLHQSSHFDRVQAFFGMVPLYLEAWEGKELAGGVRVYRYLPRRIPSLSRSFGKYLLQAGEAVLSTSCPDQQSVWEFLENGMKGLLAEEAPVYFRHYGYYSVPERLYVPEGIVPGDTFTFGNSYIDLTEGAQALWEGIHPHHRRKIHTARKLGYQVEKAEDAGKLLDLMVRTFQSQPGKGPNLGFVRHFYHCLKDQDITSVYVASDQKQTVSAVLLTRYGPVATYAFGGSIKNNDGASHLLHYRLMCQCQGDGMERYYFGQVDAGSAEGDSKFTGGISPFKRRFGTHEIINYRRTYLFKPFKYRLWRTITRLTGRK